jgi:signal transduction histidine kinase
LFIARVGDFTCHIGNGLRPNVPTYANNAKVPAMSGVARSVELYNTAYRQAWQKISEDQKREQSDMAQRLHDSIARQIKEGASVDVLIASEALKELTILSDSSNRGGHDTQKIHPGSIR